MLKNRCLITSVGRKVSLVRLFRESGWDVTGQDYDDNSVALKWCDRRSDIEQDYDIIIPTRDAELKDCYKFNLWPTDHIDICLDKLRFYNWCKSSGFKTPEVYFVKPRISKSGKETECVWQEFVEAEEYSVDLFAWEGKVISVVPRRRLRVVSGESVVTQTVRNDILSSEASTLARSLGLVGHNVLQCFLVDKKPVWTDVNCRYGGGSAVAIKAGCKSPEWLLDLINGKKVDSHIGDYQVGLTGYSYSEWCFED